MNRVSKTLLMAMIAIFVIPAINSQRAAAQDQPLISVNAADVPLQYRRIFLGAVDFWNAQFNGYSDHLPRAFRNTLNSQITMTASLRPIDGIGGVLGAAGPNDVATWSQSDQFGSVRNYAVSQSGAMNFDLDDFESGLLTRDQLSAIVIHELAHALGFGTLWQGNDLIDDATGNYTFDGFALAAYRSETGNAFASFIPVENEGGGGTAGGHWEDGQSDTDGDGLPDFTEPNLFNRTNTPEFVTDYMIGSIDTLTDAGEFVITPKILTNTTLMSMKDVGLGIVGIDDDDFEDGPIKWGVSPPPIFFRPGPAVPEPGSLALLASFGLIAFCRRRR